jgi:hypothetical protein
MFTYPKWLGNLTINFLAILVFLLGPSTVLEAAHSSVISAVEVGVGGFYKPGKWTPVTVKIDTSKISSGKSKSGTTSQVQLKLTVTDSNGNRVTYPGKAVSLSGSTEIALKGWFQTGRTEDVLEVTIEDAESHKTIDSSLISLSESREEDQPKVSPVRQSVYLVAGVGNPSGFNKLGEIDEDEDDRDNTNQIEEAHFISLESLNHIPVSAKGLDGLDAVVIAGEVNVSDETDLALKQWVKAGGHLILSVGRNGKNYQDSLLSKWIPFTVKSNEPLRELTELEIFSGKRRVIPFNRQVHSTQLKEGTGKALVSTRKGVLIAQCYFGFGKITFIGVDLHKAPFLKWSPLKSVARKILFGAKKKSDETTSENSQLAQLGISDLATQIRNYMEDFKSVKRLSNWSILGIVLVYLIIIGPLDYFIVHRILKKPHWTWITFPIFIACAVIISVNNARAMNGSDLKIHSFDIYDLDVAGKYSRTLSYFDIYSPETRRYQIQSSPEQSLFPDTLKLSQPVLNWSGSPEEGVGGVYRMAGVDAGLPSYLMGESDDKIANLPIQIWSTANLQVNQNNENADFIQSSLTSSGLGRLKGEITHQFSTPLDSWFVFYQDKIYYPDPDSKDESLTQFKPGVSFSLEQKGIKQENLKRYLTGTTVSITKSKTQVGNDYRSQQSSYDAYSKNPYRIIQAISFYKKTGGESYFHLKNNVLKSYDLSGFLDHDRAILLAKINIPATKLELNGKPIEASRHIGFIRIVLPVDQIKTERKLIEENSTE